MRERRRARKLFSHVGAVDEKERRKFKVAGLGIGIIRIMNGSGRTRVEALVRRHQRMLTSTATCWQLPRFKNC